MKNLNSLSASNLISALNDEIKDVLPALRTIDGFQKLEVVLAEDRHTHAPVLLDVALSLTSDQNFCPPPQVVEFCEFLMRWVEETIRRSLLDCDDIIRITPKTIRLSFRKIPKSKTLRF